MADQSSSSSDQDPSREGIPDHEELQIGAESTDEYAPGNRPAEGANVATPGSVFDQEWNGQPGATDFLGLDQELAQDDGLYEPEAPVAPAAPYAPEEPAAAEPFEVTHQEPMALAEEPLLEPETAAEGMSSSWFMEGGDDTAVVEDGEREGYASSTEEQGAAHDLGLDDVDESWFEEEAGSGGLRRKLIVVGVLALLGVGGTFGYKAYSSKDSGSGETLVAKPSAPVTPAGAVETQPPAEIVAPGDGGGTRAIAGSGGVSIPIEPAPQGGATIEPTRPIVLVPETSPQSGQADPLATGEPTGSESDPVQGALPALDPVASGGDPMDPFGPELLGAGQATAPQGVRPTSPQVAGVDHRSTLIQPEELIVDGSELGGVRIASTDDLGAIWPNETVPEELIRGKRKVLTPAVGRVRVILKTDEIFEGSLYALGHDTVWVESIHGRMGLDNNRIDRIDRIATAAGSPVLGGTGSEKMTGLDRVCIKAEGGTFFGKMISQNENKTIVITDGGARLTLHNSEVEVLVGKNPEVLIKF